MTENYSFDKNQVRIDYTTLTPRFSVTNNDNIANGIAHLNDHGYAIFSDVMNEDDINKNKELLWDFLENIPRSSIRRNDPTTWSNNWPGNTRFGLVNTYGIGQSDFMWNVRSNRNIKRIYSQIWNTNELLVSLEGCGVFRNWYHDRNWKTSTGWYHVDQNPRLKPDLCSYQGFISLTAQNETTGGLIVFPRTHLRFKELVDVARRPKDFIPIPSMHSILDRGTAIGKLVQCQPGDYVIWDGRLVHCNSPAFISDDEFKNSSIDLLRIVGYVTMSPTRFIRDYTLDQFRAKRKILVQNNATLTHWCTDLVEASKNINDRSSFLLYLF